MTVISTKSITGVTSITSPQSDDAVTLHTNDTTQRVSVTTGGMNVTGVVTTTGGTFNGDVTFTGTLEGGSGFSISSGNLTLPAYTYHDGDSDTYYGFSGANQFSVFTGGQERLKIDGNGVVKITRRLELTNSGDNHHVYEGRSWTWTSNGTSTGSVRAYMYGDSSGNLRVGTNGWNERLRITGVGSFGINNSDPKYTMHFKNAMSSSPSWIHMQVTGSNTVGGGGGIAFDTSASNDDSNNSLFLATIAGVRNSADNGSNDLVFSTSTNGVNGSAPVEKLRITSAGVISFDAGTTAAVTPSQTTAATIGGGAFSGGSSWFNHDSGTDYFGVDGDHKLTNGATYGKIVARNSSGSISNSTQAGHTWFLVMKTVAGTLGNSNWVVETVAGWKMAWPTSLGDGATATFYMRDAVESYGSPTIPASGDYYIGWCYSTSQQMGTNGGAYYVDDTSGGKIYYYSGEGDMSNAHQRIPRQGDSWDDTMSGEKIHFKFETLPKADLTGTVFSSPLLVDPVMQGTPLVDGFPMAGGQLVKDVQWSNNVASVEFMNADFVNSNYLLTYSINATDGNDNTSGWYQTRMQFCDHDGSWKNSTNDYISHCEWVASDSNSVSVNSSFAGYAKSMWLTGNGSNYDHMGWVWIIPSNFRHNRDTTIAQNWGDGTSYTISEHPHIMVRGHSFLTSGNQGQSYREEGGGIYRGSNDLYTLSGFRIFGCSSSDDGSPVSNGASNGYVRIWRFKSGFEAREVS